MHLGASPGAALAFLIAGSATNPTFYTTVCQILGRRAALVYLAAVGLSGIGCALLLDAVFSLLSSAAPQIPLHAHEMTHGGWMSSVWAIALFAVLAFSYFTGWRDAQAERNTEKPEPKEAPPKKHCEHCGG